MAEADPKMVLEPASEGVAEEEMASSASDSGEESESSSSSSGSSSSSSSRSSSSSSSTSSSSSSTCSSRSRLYRKRRFPEPSRRAQRAPWRRSFVESLPQAVRNRVQALRNIQNECDKVDAMFLRAIHDLERKYAQLNKPLYDKRFQIINAEYEPTEEECEWNSEDEEFSSDEEVPDASPSEMPPLEGEEDDPKEKSEMKAEEKEAVEDIPEAKAEEKEDPTEIPEVKAEEKETPEENVEVKAEEQEVPEEAAEVKAEDKGTPGENPEVKAEEKPTVRENPEAKAKEEEKEDSEDCMQTTPEEKEDSKEVAQVKADDMEEPTATKPKVRVAVREAHKRLHETRPRERMNLKRARKGKPKREDPKGIPDYWLKVLKNVDRLGPMIQKYDEPILRFLSDISLKFSKPGQPISYTFEFHFLPNPYFRNELLVKTYMIKSKPDHNDPFFSWGWEIEDCKGCKIDWRRGKDVTVTTTYSRTTATGEIEILPRVVPNASFFNFFSPPEIPHIGKLEPREDAILDEDFEIGQILHDNVILKSIYYYTGEVNGAYYHNGKDYGNRKYRK